MELDLEVVHMAKCLMLLAESGGATRKHHCFVGSYECRTCKKSFSSFQALGGHRASHSHHHERAQDHKKQRSMNRTQDDRIETSYKMKSYKCSVCSSEFSSGQALGGHMRKHRALVNCATNNEMVSFDLNFPPVEEDEDH